MIPTDWAIRDAIRGIIAAADTAAVVIPKFILDVAVGENANLLKPTSGTDSGKVHGWMIDRGPVSNVRHGAVRWDANDPATSYRIDATLSYSIWFLYRYALGSEASDTDSTETFNTLLDDVTEAFAIKPRLGITTTSCGGGSQIKQHKELQIEDVNIVPVSSSWAHFAQCKLDVDIYRTPAD